MKQNQWVAVSISFVLTVTLWLLVTLNTQSYSSDFKVPIRLTNFPDNLQLTTDFPKEIQVFATGKGIKLLYQTFDPIVDSVEVDFELFRSLGYFDPSTNLRLINGSLQPGLSSYAVNPDTISLKYAAKASRKVAVVIDVDFNIPSSFRVPAKNLEYPDSVLLIGPEDSISKITHVKTRRIKLPASAEAKTVMIPLDSMGTFQTLPHEIELTYKPLPYTEKILMVPVRTLGAPLGVEFRVDPETLKVKILVPLNAFEAITPKNVFAVVNYSEISPRSEYVIPHIRNLPESGEIVSYSPELLHYLLIVRE